MTKSTRRLAEDPPTDAGDPRQRILDHALEIFASKGYEGASTREICRCAEVNVAAIHYYFGDKASLYRQLFDALEQFQRLPVELTNPAAPIETVLLALYRHLLDFTASSATTQHLRTLFMREQLSPTGLLNEEQMQGVLPLYEAVIRVLEHRLNVAADAELRLLAFSLLGLASTFVMGRDTLDRIAPELMQNKEHTLSRLIAQAVALIEMEAAERRADESDQTRGGDTL